VRIAVDARHLDAGRGVARATRRLLDALVAAAPQDDWRPVVPSSRLVHGAAALVGRPRLDRMAGGADVAWLPAPAPVAIGSGVPYVVTVHDLSWVLRPADFTAYERLWHGLGRIRARVEGATRVIASSQATREALTGIWDVDPDRIRVVRLAPGLQPSAASRAPRATGDGRPYFLAVGALEPRKAPDLLVRAFARARARGLAADLVLAGAGRLAPTLGGDGVRLLGAVDDEALADLYAGAIALVAPSWLEGFGLAPVEAATFGTPSIVADLAVYDETIGAGAARVPPGDERALAEAMLDLAQHPVRCAELAAEAARAIAGLTWERAARETHAVLAEAAG